MRFLLALVGGLALIVGAMNGLLGYMVSQPVSGAIRVVCILTFASTVVLYIWAWSEKHPSAFPKAATPRQNETGWPLDDVTVWRRLEAITSSQVPLTAQECRRIALQLSASSRTRERVVENVLLGRRSMLRSVSVQFRRNVVVSDRSTIVCFARPPKWQALEDAKIVCESDPDAEVLPFIESLAVTYQICLYRLRAYAPNPLTDAERQAVARLVARPSAADSDARSLFRVAFGKEYDRNIADAREEEFYRILSVLRHRRPMYMRVDASKRLPKVRYEYTVKAADKSFYVAAEDRWTRFKSAVRDVIGLSPTQIGINIGRARTASRYVLNVEVPDGMYIAEAACFDRSKGPLPKMKHGEMYSSYINWQQPGARSRTTLAVRDFKLLRTMDSHFLIRLEERPPGTLATATVTAVATAFTIWISAVISGSRDDPGADIVAFLLAAPGIVALALGLNLTEGSNRLRSLTGILSLVSSLAISAGAITVFLAEATGRLDLPSLPGGRTFFFIHDQAWAVLVAAAVANVVVAVTTWGTRLVRYRKAYH